MNKKVAAAEFCALTGESEARLSELERLTLFGGRDLVRYLKLSRAQFKRFSIAVDCSKLSIGEILGARDLYSEYHPTGDREFFHVPSLVPARMSVVHGLDDGLIVDLKMHSGFVSHCERQHVTQLFDDVNTELRARWWRHSGGGKPTVIAIHGLQMGDRRVAALAFLPGMLYRLGYDVLLYELPLHGRRDPQAKMKGVTPTFPTANPYLITELINQAIFELQLVRTLVLQEGAKGVGWMGVSLGAYLGLLWSSIEKFDFALAAVPLISVSSIAWEIVRHHPEYKTLKASGISRKTFEEIFMPITPGDKFNVPASHTLVLGGLADALVRAKDVRALADKMGGAQLAWLRGGHGAPFSEAASSRLKTFFKRVMADLQSR